MVVIAENFVYDCCRSTGKLENESEKKHNVAATARDFLIRRHRGEIMATPICNRGGNQPSPRKCRNRIQWIAN